MRELLILAIHLLITFAKLLRPGGVRAVAAESILLKHQLLISNRSRQRAPNLTTLDRFVLGLSTLFVSPHRIAKLGALVKPATLLKFHKALVDHKYRLLFSSSRHPSKPGPKGPSAELVAAIATAAGRCSREQTFNESRYHRDRTSQRKGPQTTRSVGIAVGTPIAGRPPHRSVRAEFPHTAPIASR
jgi:hypothetical protein